MKKKLLSILGLIVVGGLLFLGFFLNQVVDWLWFRSLGAQYLFWLPLLSTLLIRLGLGLIAFLFLFLNLRQTKKAFFELSTEVQITPRQHLFFTILASLLLTLFLLPGFSLDWPIIQQFLHRSPFGVADPIFEHDLSFYLFAFPLYQKLSITLQGLLILAFLSTALFYLLPKAYWYQERSFQLWPRARIHLTILGALFFLLKAVDHYLGRYSMLFEEKSLLTGVDFTARHLRIFGQNFLALSAIGVAVLLLLSISYKRPLRLVLTGLGLWLGAFLLFTMLIPPVVESLWVKPNQFIAEEEFLEHHLKFTRLGFGLDRIKEQPFRIDPESDLSTVDETHPSLANLRIWDWRPLLPAYNQLQSFRSYYTFYDLDIDRYPSTNGQKQVMIAARELEPRKTGNNWLNTHLTYTHGYGLAINEVSRANQVGQPLFLVKDLPPVVDPTLSGLQLNRPEIYFGERPSDYLIVRTKQKEFNYPAAEAGEYITTTYQGRDGISLRRWLSRLLFALKLKERNLILSGYLEEQSRILLHCNIKDRVTKLAPFLNYDHDPYPVVADGRLFWMIDAYTTSRYLPYAKKHRQGFNYIRNSVKVVVDAYHGTVDFYVCDETDPVIQTWQRIFPRLFKPFSAMPATLQQHIRYPETLFAIQQEMLLTYHLTSPKSFYEKEDFWNTPTQLYGDNQEPLEPYYVTLQLPGETKAEFLLMQPFTPQGKQNMISWLVARCDQPHYGELILYHLPKGTNTYGPMQIEARIGQHPEITEMISLWNQNQSRLIRGNLLVIPLENNFLYAEPFYIVSKQGEIPEFKKIVLAYQERIAIGDSIAEALQQLKKGLAQPASLPQAGVDLPSVVPPGAATFEVRGLDPALLDQVESYLLIALEVVREAKKEAATPPPTDEAGQTSKNSGQEGPLE
ncbi:MAG: UPF0182 family protein [Firmicutes bacterium]|nr:UPF0182 family protein [Bacillota bacterium]